ncbi:MAG: acetoacetate--CoA ligase, partial [Solirubrobacteraceae bacterium]|nr:acetoacetate--CoA ligase [Solirubrobacteraceae bacterium]
RPSGEWTWSELERATAQLRAVLAERGVGEGDRVAAYLPNIPETIAAFLACASLGAIWSSAAPEFGAQAVIDRFSQLEPTVLLAVDGYRYGGKTFDRTAEVDAIHAAVGGELLRFGYLDGTGWSDELPQDPPPLTFADTAFDAPLWILFSSGTTGLPKPIVQGHGGILLEQLKHGHLHLDARPGDRVFWFTTTGWMMWNFLVGVLHTGAAIVLFDGDPAGDVLWNLAERTQTTIFGTSAAYLTTAMRSGIHPTQARDLAIRAVGSTGSPLPPEAFRWVIDEFGSGTWLFSTSGGTDVCTAFVGGVPTLPVYAGELQAPALGAKVESWSPEGEPLVGEVGELVITLPLPSMPLYFWGDDDGARLTESYFATYPGIWRHGDWIELTDRGSAIIWGRSDATINRGGVRMGTSEIYRAVLAVPEIQDALVVDVPLDPVASTMWLFVVTAGGDVGEVDDDLRQRLARQIREQCSPRHVPNRVTAVPEIPRTLSGKVVEVPVKRILMGADP